MTPSIRPVRQRRARWAPWLASLTIATGAAAPSPASGQALPPFDAWRDYARLLEITGGRGPGTMTVRASDSASAPGPDARGGHPWASRAAASRAAAPQGISFEPHGVGLRAFLNSSVPVGQNDGAIWQGKGLTTALDVGATARWRRLTVTAHPSLSHTQNASFELAPVAFAGYPEYAYPWRRIDMPQRFGPAAYWTLDPGQSEIRLSSFGASVAFGTANLWWGPARRNPIVMGSHAGGFPHVSLGTDGSVGIGIGMLEVEWIWGDLSQTEWFDSSLRDVDRFLTGLMVAIRPDFLEGLTLGLTRVFYGWDPADGFTLGDYFTVFQGVRKESFATPQNPTGDDEHDQMLSLFARWVLPASGFEVYAEWARNDHSWNFRDFFLEPEHSQAYTLGLQKSEELGGGRLLVLGGELTHLERSTTRALRAVPTYYAHHIVTQGYTHEGQVIGAGIGPGGNAQHVFADVYDTWGRAGIYLQRDVRDNDAYYAWAAANNPSFYEHDVMLHAGAHGLVFVRDFELGGGLILTRELNRNFYGRDLWNLNVSLSARWRPR